MSKKLWCAPVLAGLVLLGAALPAQALPLTWTLNNVTFDDGTKATGWFVFDATTQTSTSYSVATSDGTLSAFTYDPTNSRFFVGTGDGPNNFWIDQWPAATVRYFNFSFDTPLTDAGGTIAIRTQNSYDCAYCAPWRYVTGGEVTTLPILGQAVPEPATLGLMLPALGMLGWMARRRKQKAA